MDTAIIILLFAAGVILIVKGGDFFVDAAAWMAEASGIPKFIVGATIVSFATTLPEIIVSSIAAFEGKVDMAVGNAIGSVTANTALIMAVGILFMPSIIKKRQFIPKALILIAALVALIALSISGGLTFKSSIILFAIFALFIFENIKTADKNNDKKIKKSDKTIKKVIKGKETVKYIIMFIIGAASIVIGSNLLVDNGSAIARMIGVPENIIGLTAIAIGTSLPELVTTITSIIKKQASLSIGNIIGANIIDTTLILPICAAISKGNLPVSYQTIHIDIPFSLMAACIMIIPAIFTGKLSRWQGIASLILYGIYIGILCFIS